MRGGGRVQLCWSGALFCSLCAFPVQRSCESVRQKSEGNDRANNASTDRGNQKCDALSDPLSGHCHDRQNESHGEENESEAKNPKGKESKDKTYPSSFDGR